jgi:hypothetical protein
MVHVRYTQKSWVVLTLVDEVHTCQLQRRTQLAESLLEPLEPQVGVPSE